MRPRCHTIDELPAQSLLEIDRVCSRFEDAWSSGERPRLEQYWTDSSDPHRGALLRELLLLELHYRQQRGERPSPQEYRARFPDQSDFIDETWDAYVRRADTDGEAPLPQIAGYEVLRRLGRGGMATVYLARDPRLGRFVALKLLSSAEPGAQVVARLRAEAQAIARLQHPNIVQIHEIAQHCGQPYLALEYVAGGSLAEWIAGTPRPPRPAAQLVETLARAVHAAHQHGVVHRDLKPANVLLHREPCGDDDDDDSPIVPKITDFGLAKFLDDGEGRAAAQTQSGMVVGTASYMAPEQTGGDGRHATVGPGADIYALGAILYELITGRPPFKGASVFETAMLVRTTEPVPPRQLQPNAPRDLETVCLKCLNKDPGKRYASALDLADDLQRFTRGEPVRARPVGRIESAWRWSRRNPLAAGLAAAVALLLVLGTVVSTYFAVDARRRAADNRRLADVADAKRQQAEAVSRYLVSAFRSADPERDGRAVTVVEVLDRAARQLHDEFAEQPVIEAELAATIAQTYIGLGLTSPAIELLERSRELMQAHAPADHWQTIAPLHLLARAYGAAGQVQQALPLAQEAYDRMRAAVGDEHPETMQAINTLANAYENVGQMRRAAELHERTLVWARKTLGESDLQTLSAMNNLAWALHRLGELDRAITLYEQALAGFRAARGDDDFFALAARNNLANAYSQAGRSDEAIAMLEQVLDGATRLLGEDHPNTLSTLNNLARAYRAARRFDQAIPLVRRAHERCIARLGEDHPNTINALAGLADTLSAAGRDDDALPLYQRILELRRRKLGDEHPDTLLSMNGLGRAYHLAGRREEAESLLRKCLSIRQRLAPDDWLTFDARIILGGVLLDTGRRIEAESLLLNGYEGMLARRDRIPPENQRRLKYALEQIVKLYESEGRPDESARWRAEMEKNFPAGATTAPAGD